MFFRTVAVFKIMSYLKGKLSSFFHSFETFSKVEIVRNGWHFEGNSEPTPITSQHVTVIST
jgi:uncharacterized membrane protein